MAAASLPSSATQVHLQRRPFGRAELLAVDGERRHRHGLGQRDAVAVVDGAAHRRHLHEPVALALRGDRELLAPGDLQEPEPGEQAGEEGDDEHADHGEPATAVGLGSWRHDRGSVGDVTGSQSRRRRPDGHHPRTRQAPDDSSRRAARRTIGNTRGAITAS